MHVALGASALTTVITAFVIVPDIAIPATMIARTSFRIFGSQLVLLVAGGEGCWTGCNPDT